MTSAPNIAPAVTPANDEQARCAHRWDKSPLAGYDYWCQRCLIPGRVQEGLR